MYIHVIYRTIIIALISLVACSVTFKVFEMVESHVSIIDLFTDTAAILNSEEIMGCPGGR